MANASSSFKLIKEEEISELLCWEEILPAIENVLLRYSSRHSTGGIVQPIRTSLTVPKHNDRWCLVMPCYDGEEDVFCTKMIACNPHNSELGLPNIHALILLSDGRTGQPQAVLEGETITAKRTAAASAVATKYLVNGIPKILAIFGAGMQARSHFHALHHLFNFSEVKVWNIRAASGMKFVQELNGQGINATWHSKGCNAAKDADIICVVVANTQTPILEATWVKPGAHINAIGANRPTYQELDPQLMKDGIVYVDCLETALKESGDIIKSEAKIYGEIGEVIKEPQKALREKTTIFKSNGIAIEDAVIASMVYQKVAQRSN